MVSYAHEEVREQAEAASFVHVRTWCIVMAIASSRGLVLVRAPQRSWSRRAGGGRLRPRRCKSRAGGPDLSPSGYLIG